MGPEYIVFFSCQVAELTEAMRGDEQVIFHLPSLLGESIGHQTLDRMEFI